MTIENVITTTIIGFCVVCLTIFLAGGSSEIYATIRKEGWFYFLGPILVVVTVILTSFLAGTFITWIWSLL